MAESTELSQRKKEFGSLGYVAMFKSEEGELEKYQEEQNIEKNEERSVQEELDATEVEEKNYEGCVLEEKNGDNEISEIAEDVKEKQEISNENGEENMKELAIEEDRENKDITEDGDNEDKTEDRVNEDITEYGDKEDIIEDEEEEINHLKIENFHIESDILERLLFREELEIVLHSDPIQVVGCFSINISKIDGTRDDLPRTLIVHISGKAGTDKGCECGTSVTSCVTMDFFTIDEKRYEYTQVNEFSKERQMYMACMGKHYHCETLLRLNADPMDKIVKKIPIMEAKNLVSEGANVVLLRHMALTGFNGEVKVDSILANGLICPSTYTCKEPTVISRQGQDLVVTVIERVVQESPDTQQTLRSTLTRGGQLLEHEWVGGLYLVRVTPHKKVMNVTMGYVEKSVPLEHCWKEDMELRSTYKDCKTQQLSTHKSYLVDKPEVKALLADFTQAILLLKPEDVVQFAVGYFTRFTYAQEYTLEPASQIVSDLLDELVKISVKFAGEKEIADIIRTLINSALQKDVDRDLIQLLDSMIISTVKLSDILQILVKSIGREERDKEVTKILAAMVKAAVRHKGEKEVKELLQKTVTSAVEQVEEKDEVMKVVSTMLSYAVGQEGEDVVMYLLDHILKLVVKHEDERKAERDSSGHEIITEILAEVLSSVTKRDEEEGVIKEATTEASHEEETQ